jgi:hypothetical protein
MIVGEDDAQGPWVAMPTRYSRIVAGIIQGLTKG